MIATVDHACKPGDAAVFQDRTYGPGMRVFTDGGVGARPVDKVRCTVCGYEALRLDVLKRAR